MKKTLFVIILLLILPLSSAFAENERIAVSLGDKMFVTVGGTGQEVVTLYQVKNGKIVLLDRTIRGPKGNAKHLPVGGNASISKKKVK